jgi:hypothetical protein
MRRSDVVEYRRMLSRSPCSIRSLTISTRKNLLWATQAFQITVDTWVYHHLSQLDGPNPLDGKHLGLGCRFQSIPVGARANSRPTRFCGGKNGDAQTVSSLLLQLS